MGCVGAQKWCINDVEAPCIQLLVMVGVCSRDVKLFALVWQMHTRKTMAALCFSLALLI